jgi:hypothetical protein
MYYFYKNQQGYVQARATYEYSAAYGSNWTNNSYGLLVSALIPVNDKLRLNPSLEYIKQPYSNPWFNGATFQGKRHDNIFVVGFQVLYKVYKNIDANLHYYYIRGDSNIPLYDYDRTIAGLLLEYRY